MGLRDKSYVKAWAARQNGKTYSVKINISKKDESEKSGYKTLFDDFVNFAGEAANKIAKLGLPEKQTKGSKPVSLQITSSPDISTWYDEKKHQKLKELTNNEELLAFINANVNKKTITIWDFEVAGENNSNQSFEKSTNEAITKPADEDEELPF